ncbi:Multidrug resistance protein sirA [Penicillium antarcticum]|uniref:Multidrug resistance protein sirA n=1 Tax=Penicillium antarcticum TaxID=416450 RepID=UPI002383B98D|nr:Multidrug resistance protein sirA [Penicillium antarcticum]KAJ5312435.1 Multidrug resistance protein sirA [Penicillium antarcticum]
MNEEKELTGASTAEEELDIIHRQLHVPTVNASFFSLFAYATTRDLGIIAVSTLCALAAGAIIPLPPIIFGRLSYIFAGLEDGRSTDPNSSHLISYYSLFFVYIAIGALVVWFVSIAGFSYTGARVASQVKVQYMESILRQNIALFDDIGTGQMLAQLGADLNTIQDALSFKLSLTLSAVGTLLATYIVSFALYWKLTFILIWSIFLSLALLYAGNRIAVHYSTRSMEAQATGSSIAEEALGSIRSTTALGLQPTVVDSYDGCLGVSQTAGFTLKALMGTMVAITVGTGYLNVALAFWQGSKFLVDKQTSFMAVVAITLITKSAAFCVLGVGQNAETFTNAAAASRRLFQIIRRDSPIDSTASSGNKLGRIRGDIEMHNIKHVYPMRPNVVVTEDLSLSFPAGKTTAVVGPSGSGKSTISKLLLRFYEPLNGQITLDGHDIKSLNVRWLRQQLRLVNQEPSLFDTTIQENIEYGFVGSPLERLPAEEKQLRVEQAARIACAHDFIIALPDRYQTMTGTKGSKLSGGQKQRIAIARALVAQPKILILDEATSALDTKTEASVQATLKQSSKNRTTVLVAHRLSTIRDADNIVVLKAGKLAEQGTHDELMHRRGEYFHLVEAQQSGEDEEKPNNELELLGVDESTAILVAEKQETFTETKRFDVATDDSNTDQHPSTLAMTRFVLSLNAKQWKWILIGLISSVIAGLEEPASAVLFGKAVVAIAQPLDRQNTIRSDAGFWAWMFFLLAVVMMIVFSIQGSVFAFCSEKLVRQARKLAFAQMLRQEMAFFDEKGNTAAALSSFLSTEAADLAGVSGGTLGMILIGISTLVSALAVGLAFGWKLALVCSSVIPVLIASGFIGIWASNEFERLNEQYTRASAEYAGEAIGAIQTVALLTRESDVLASYEKKVEASSGEGTKANLKASLVLAFGRAAVNACMALGFWYGGSLILSGEYTLLQFVIVYSSIITSAYSAGLVFSFTPNISKARRSAAGLQALLQRESIINPDSSDGQKFETPPKGQIDFCNVSFIYPTRPGHLALRNVSLSISPGSRVALVGHTGCGKSTIISLIERFYDPSSGGIFFDGQPISSLCVTDYRRCIGLVNQEPTMLRGSIRMNLTAGQGDGITDTNIENACKQANIYDFVCSLPDGFNTVVGNRGDQLSGGQRQRLALARALVRNPTILLLDEATSAVDAQSEALIQEALDHAAQGRTTITIAHRLSTVRNADVIYVLDQGSIVEHGSHGQLMERGGKYFEMFTASADSR